MIQFDFSKSGVSEEELETCEPLTALAHKKIEKERKEKLVGWWELPFDEKLPRSVLTQAEHFSKNFETLLVIGIGGSSQGAKMALHALTTPHLQQNIYFLESPDPWSVESLLEHVDFSNAAVNVVSKSGNTIETLSILESLPQKLKTKDRMVVTTATGEGKLFQMAMQNGWVTLPMPRNVGGRFSVFSAAALFQMAFAGIDIFDFLKGAREALQSQLPYKNGLIHHLLCEKHGKNISALLVYSEALSEFGGWYAQLLAESLGKGGKGQTPLVAQGPQVQHSLAQLFLDGPKDKVVTGLRIENHLKDPLGDLLARECRATLEALHEKKCPVIEIVLPQLSANALGELLMSYQMQIAFTGHLMNINPYDQPAVELIKKRI